MKSSALLLPCVTAVAGFAVAWFAKPVPPVVAKEVDRLVTEAAPRASRSGPERAASSANKPPAEVHASDFPLSEQMGQAPKSRGEAKMLRLAEALGLAVDQQAAIAHLIEQAHANPNPEVGALRDLAMRGKLLEDGLRGLLTPEQWTKFEQLRDRAKDNLGDLRAQEEFKTALEDIDLSTQQKSEILSRLREKAKADLQGIPAAATLLFRSSVLPVGDNELAVDGVLLLAQIGDDVSYTDASEAHQKITDRNLAELERLLKCFDGVLTPAQMGQYQATIAERQELLKRLPAGLGNRPMPEIDEDATDEPGPPDQPAEADEAEDH